MKNGMICIAVALEMLCPLVSAQWSRQTSGTGARLRGVAFVSDAWGYAVGDSGIILHTTNGGTSWLRQYSGTTDPLNSVVFVDSLRGWAVGGVDDDTAGVLLHTRDGGATWVQHAAGLNSTLTCACLLGRSIVHVADAGGNLLSSTDGGETWGDQHATYRRITSVEFHGQNLGMVTTGLGDPGPGGITISTDGGKDWIEEVHPGASGPGRFVDLSDGHWADSLTVVAVGASVLFREAMSPGPYLNDMQGAYFGEGRIFRSTDRGVTWSRAEAESTCSYHAVSFANETIGTAVGAWTIARTTDGGATWKTQVSDTGLYLYDVVLRDANHGWAVGNRGTILRTINGGIVTGVRDRGTCREARDIVLEQNYPNPFNGSSELGFRIADVSMVKLQVFDLLGREIATVVDERLGPGEYSVRFDPGMLASGTYLYRLMAGSYVETKRLCLVR